MVTTDGAGASHGLIKRLHQLAQRPGHQLVYSVGWDFGPRERAAVGRVPAQAWQTAIDPDGGPAPAPRRRRLRGHPVRSPAVLGHPGAGRGADRAAARPPAR